MHRDGMQRTSWTLRNRERKQEGRTRREGTISMGRGKRRESSAKVSRHRHLMNAQRGNPVRRSAGTRVLMSAQLGFSSEVDPGQALSSDFLCWVTPALRNFRAFGERSARIFLKCGTRGKSGKMQILRRNGSSGRRMTKIQLILRNL